jgi:hypothetical protein
MKKVLFATTALVATAGVASADIALSGSAQMGIQGGNNTANDTTQFVQDIDITFTMSGTADNGTTFGAAIDLDENAAGVNQDDAGVAIFISGDLGTLTLGDTDGALDWAMQEVDFNGAASINDDHTTHAGFNGNGGLDGHYDGQILRYDYSFGDFSFACRSSRTTTRRRWATRSALVSCRLQRLTVTRSGASVPSTPACSQAAPSASASVTRPPTTVTRYLPRRPALRDRYLRKRRTRLRLLGC